MLSAVEHIEMPVSGTHEIADNSLVVDKKQEGGRGRGDPESGASSPAAHP